MKNSCNLRRSPCPCLDTCRFILESELGGFRLTKSINFPFGNLKIPGEPAVGSGVSPRVEMSDVWLCCGFGEGQRGTVTCSGPGRICPPGRLWGGGDPAVLGLGGQGGFAVLQQLLQRMVRMRRVTPRVATPVTLSCPGGPHSGFPFPPDSICSLLGWEPLEYLTGGFVESLFTVPVQN